MNAQDVTEWIKASNLMSNVDSRKDLKQVESTIRSLRDDGWRVTPASEVPDSKTSEFNIGYAEGYEFGFREGEEWGNH